MIKENQKLLNRINIISDAVISFIAVTLSYFIIFHVLDFEKNYPLIDYLKLATIFVPIKLITYGCSWLYDSFRTKTFFNELNRLFTAQIIDGVIMLTLLYITHFFNFSRWALFVFLVLDFVFVAIKRFCLRRVLKSVREKGYNLKYVLIVGSGEAAEKYLETIKSDKSLGLECVGYLGKEGALGGVDCLGDYDRILSVLDERSYDEVVCALDSSESETLSDIVEACELTGTKISVIPVIYKYMSATPSIDVVGGIPMMNIRRIPLDNFGNAFFKRATDIVGSLVLLILTSPLILVSMLIIKLTMGGKVIFKQKRIGLNKKIFTMYKLKSMKDNAESDTAWSTDNDPRKTRFGAFIRKFSIDELPQLVNVLKGDMSLVGPRPEIPFYVNTFKDSVPMYMIKHQVKPGITGLAQVNGYRGDTSIEKRIEFDIQYIENWSYFLDISILFRTLFSFMNKEKLKPAGEKKQKKRRIQMNNQKKYDMTTLAIFFPAVIALAIVPVLMRATLVSTELKETQRYFAGTELDGVYYFADVFSQCKAFAVVVFAIIMLSVALLCCMFLFKRAEKRTLAIVGASVVYVVMALISAAMSDYQHIAFYGDYERAEGFFTTACYFVMFLFTMYAFRDAQNFRPIIFALFFCVGVNAVLGIFQFTGNNLETKEWFNNIIVDRQYAGAIMPSTETDTKVYGALYHYNYVGSFAGMMVPLFTVLSLFEKKIGLRIGCIIADLLSIFMLLGSTARSGIVAVAAAAVVGIFIFFRVIIKHWKVSLSVTAAAAAAIFGVNAAMDGAILRRVPTIFSDIVDFVKPSENGETLFDHLPVKEIKQLDNGSVVFVTAKDELTLSFDNDWAEYHLTDKAGEEVGYTVDSKGNCVIADDEGRFEGIELSFYSSEETNGEYYDFVFFTMPGNDNNSLLFRLYGYNNIKLTNANTDEKIPIYNAEYIGFEGKEKVGSSRGYIWSRTFPLLKNCLVKGYGADTFTYYFPQYDYLAKFYCYDGFFNMTVDKVHNLYLQQLFSHGLIAFIAMMFIFIWYMVDCLRLYALRREYRIEQIYGASIMLAVVGYLAAGFFNDSCVSVAPVFWILLGVGFALNTINRRMDKGESVELDEEVDVSRKLSKREIQISAQAEAASSAVLERVRQEREEKAAQAEHVSAEQMLSLLQKIDKIAAKPAESGGSGADNNTDVETGEKPGADTDNNTDNNTGSDETDKED